MNAARWRFSQAFRKTIFGPEISLHNGRFAKLMGDDALVEFTSVVDAVAAAIAIQAVRRQGPTRI